MINNYRVEISFKDFDQLKKRLDFCVNKKIYKINIERNYPFINF